MHELSVVLKIVDTASKYAAANDGSKVSEIYMEIGILNEIVESMLFDAFQYASRGTICEGAELVVRWIPITLQCKKCGKKVNVSIDCEEAVCPVCGSEELSFISGNEFIIDHIGITS